MNEKADVLLTLDEVREFLQCSPEQLNRWISRRNDPLPTVVITKKTKRVWGAQLKQWLDRQVNITK